MIVSGDCVLQKKHNAGAVNIYFVTLSSLASSLNDILIWAKCKIAREY